MKFLVELDRCNSGQWLGEAATHAFLQEVILPTLDRAQALVEQGCILAGGPVAGSIALRFIVEVESALHLDQLVSSIPLWSVSQTRVTPLLEFSDRHWHGLPLLQRHLSRMTNASNENT